MRRAMIDYPFAVWLGIWGSCFATLFYMLAT